MLSARLRIGDWTWRVAYRDASLERVVLKTPQHKPDYYLVRVERTDRRGFTAVALVRPKAFSQKSAMSCNSGADAGVSPLP
jgi:hypothetical protein